MMSMRLAIPLGAALAALTLHPPVAHACGGTFCDGPGAVTVDQTAETVLFLRDGEYVEAHIQIAIDPDTDADEFAWIVPMSAIPEFAIGSQPLFDALLEATTPRLWLNGSCGDWGGGFIDTQDGGGSQGEVVFDDVVGAFQIAVLQGGTVDSIMQWLGDNGYTQDPAAAPILESYLEEDHVFVAFKLAASATVDEIHPVVLRYVGTEPCVPIRLTAIAAAEDMGVRVFGLGEHRYAPTNYRHIVVNPLRWPWNAPQSAYDDAVTLAVDETRHGHGFITEYAGPSELVSTAGLYGDAWNGAAFVDLDPVLVVDQLVEQGLASCNGFACWVPHPLVVTLLRKYLPAPEDVTEAEFYPCVSCFEDQIDLASWDGPAFAAELDERVIEPGRHAFELMATWPYLTRMYTTLSPHEMTVDPMFHENPDLLDVPRAEPAMRVCPDDCDAEAAILPDGRVVVLDGAPWPTFPGMPWAERIEEIGPFGPPIVELDNRDVIDSMLASWNAEHDPDECMPPSTTGTSGSGDPMDPYGDGDGGGTSGGDPEQDGGIAGRGCGCRSSSPAAPAWLALVPLGLLLAPRRRRWDVRPRG
jgi:MYXO-CTERM domain-containing protein